jgi:ribosomal protein L29
MQQANGTLEHPSELRKARKEVARIKTILKEREIAGGIE